MSYDDAIAEAARRADRRARGLSLHETPAELAELKRETDDRLEKEIQAEVRSRYIAYGCKVYNLSQARATKQSPGLGDLFVICPAAGCAFWHESKTPDGEQSPAQEEFERALSGTKTGYVKGGVVAAEEQLITLGVAERINGSLETRRIRQIVGSLEHDG